MWSQFSPSTFTWEVLGNELRLPSLLGKHFHSRSHLISKPLYFFISKRQSENNGRRLLARSSVMLGSSLRSAKTRTLAGVSVDHKCGHLCPRLAEAGSETDKPDTKCFLKNQNPKHWQNCNDALLMLSFSRNYFFHFCYSSPINVMRLYRVGDSRVEISVFAV